MSTSNRRSWTVLGLVGSLCMLVAVGALVLWSARQQRVAASWVEHTHVVIEELGVLARHVTDAESARFAYSLTHDEKARARVDPHIDAAFANLINLRSLIADNSAQRARIDSLDAIVRRRATLLREALAHQPASGQATVAPDAITLSAEIRQQIEQMIDVERQLLLERAIDDDAQAQRVSLTSIGGLALSVVLIGIAFAVATHEGRARQQAQSALSLQHGLLTSIVEGTSDMIYVKDLDGRFSLVNHAGAQALAQPIDRIVGKRDVDFFSPAVAAQMQSRDREVLQRGAPVTMEEVLPFGDRARTLLTTRSPQRDDGGAIIGVIGVARDITDRKAEEVTRTRDGALLLEMGDLLLACRSVDEACAVIARFVPRFAPDIGGALSIFHASRNALDLGATWGTPLPVVDNVPLLPEECWGLRRGQPHLVADTIVGTSCSHLPQPAPRSSLCLPFVAQGEVLGVLHVASDDALDESLAHRLSLVGRQIAMSIANLQLRQQLRNQSIRDPLTGLFNRRYAEETLEREMHRAARTQESVGVILIDVDHFKRFNDTFGHAAGDVVLKELSQCLQSGTRGSDVASRLGGEELLVVLPGASLEHTERRAEALRVAVSELEVMHLGRSLGRITISLGVAAYPVHGEQVEALLRAADTALYRAKHEGRNRVVIAN